MSKRRRYTSTDPLFFQQRLLGQKIGAQFPFYRETALIHADQRRQYAGIEIIKILNKNLELNLDPETLKILDTVKLIIQKIGVANLERTELTDLALKTGKAPPRSSAKNVFKELQDQKK